MCARRRRVNSFSPLITALVRRRGGTKRELAQVLGTDPANFSRHTAPLLVCLQLAHVLGASASEVLIAAGHTAENRMLEELYGPAKRPHPLMLNLADMRRLRVLHSLTPHEARAFDAMLALARPKRSR